MEGWRDANAQKIRTSACYSGSKCSRWSSLESGEKPTTTCQTATERRRESKQGMEMTGEEGKTADWKPPTAARAWNTGTGNTLVGGLRKINGAFQLY